MTVAGRIGAFAALAILVAACAFGECRMMEPPGPDEPIDARLLGNLMADPGGGPPVECRGLDRQHCEVGFGAHAGGPVGDVRAVQRIVVSCIGQCAPEGGSFRIDVIDDAGNARNLGSGAYGEAGQSCR